MSWEDAPQLDEIMGDLESKGRGHRMTAPRPKPYPYEPKATKDGHKGLTKRVLRLPLGRIERWYPEEVGR